MAKLMLNYYKCGSWCGSLKSLPSIEQNIKSNYTSAACFGTEQIQLAKTATCF